MAVLALPTVVASAVLAAGFTGMDAITATAVGIAGRWSTDNVETNARNAYTTFRSTAPAGAWTTRKFSAYPLGTTALLPVATAAVAAVKTPVVSQISGAAASGLTAAGETAQAATTPLAAISSLADRLSNDQGLWLRVAKVVAGTGLILIGINMLVASAAVKVAAPIVGDVVGGTAKGAVRGVAKAAVGKVAR